MEALGILRFWRNAGADADVRYSVDDVRNSAFGTDEEETDDEDSFFDLVIESPNRVAAKMCDGNLKKDARRVESRRDVFSRKTEFKCSKPQSPVSILRPGPKLKVFILGLKKSPRCEKTDPSAVETKARPGKQLSRSTKLERSNRFAVKTKPPASVQIFDRDNCSRTKMVKESCDYGASPDVLVSKEKSVPKYMKLIKPFYVKASSRARSSDSFTPSSSPLTAPANLSPRRFCQVSRVRSFKIMTKNMGKSRSDSMSDFPSAPPIRRRDDSLLEHHDGIQGAILHCKKSLNTSSCREFSQLSRVASDNSHEKLTRNPFDEQKRCSI